MQTLFYIFVIVNIYELLLKLTGYANPTRTLSTFTLIFIAYISSIAEQTIMTGDIISELKQYSIISAFLQACITTLANLILQNPEKRFYCKDKVRGPCR